MSTAWRRFEAFKEAWIKFFSFVLFVAITINFLEIVVRVVFESSIDLMFDLPAWLTTWSMLLIAGFIHLENGHLSIEALSSKVKGKTKKILGVVNNLLTILFAGTITYAGILFTSQLYKFNTVYSRIISVPKWAVEICVPIGMGIFTLCAVVKLIVDLREKYDESNALEDEQPQ